MIEPRIYRAAFLPTLLAVVLVAFSLETPPAPLPQGLAADALFEGTLALGTVKDIVSTTPDRTPGSAGDFATAARVKSAFLGSGFPTTLDRFTQDDKGLVNVIGKQPGNSSREIVVMAARDAHTKPDATGSAADTAALIEFARVFQGRASQHTLVLASVDGGTLGDAGASRFLATAGDASQIDEVIVLSNLGASRSRGPTVIAWSNDAQRGNVGLERTVTESLREEVGQVPHQESWFPQFARLAFPIAPGAQGVLLPAGVDAVRIGGSGELPPAHSGLADVNADRYGALGRGALRAVSALDNAGKPPPHGPDAYVEIAGKLLPGWSIKLLAICLMLPALLTSIDALARARRRKEPIAQWGLWLLSGVVPFVLAFVLAEFLVLVGLADDAPAAALDPSSISLDVRAVCALVATGFTIALAWVLGRSSVIRRAGTLPNPSAPGAACLTALAFAALGMTLAITNPFAALVIAPAVHLWMLATLTNVRPRTSVIMAVLGVAPIVAIVVYYLWRFELDPLTGAYYLFLLVTGTQVGWLTIGACIALLAITGSVAAILVARARTGVTGAEPRPVPRRGPETPVFGPGGHAGPGALGGTSSALRR